MQISRHWRMKALRYRLEGVRTPANQTNSTQPNAQLPRATQPDNQAQPALTPIARGATAAR
jgi:hypothetical protein